MGKFAEKNRGLVVFLPMFFALGGCGKWITNESTGLGKKASDSVATNVVSPKPAPPRVVKEAEILSLCSAGSRKTYKQEFIFKDSKTECAWNMDGNLTQEDGSIRARTEQNDIFLVPENSVICSLDFTFPEQDMRYDDNMLLTYNDVILISNFDPSSVTGRKGGFPVYSWTGIQNASESLTETGQHYCISNGEQRAECNLPRTQNFGKMTLDLNKDIMMRLSQITSNETRHKFSLITTGDNDPSDCQHMDLSFNVSVEYVPR